MAFSHMFPGKGLNWLLATCIPQSQTCEAMIFEVIPIGSTGLMHLPTLNRKNHPNVNVGKCTIHASYGIDFLSQRARERTIKVFKVYTP